MNRRLLALLALVTLPALMLGLAAPSTTATTSSIAAATTPATTGATTRAPSCPSRGTGGAFTDRFNQSFTDPKTGRTSQFHIWAAGLNPNKPVGIVIQLHGDGADEFDAYSSRTGKLARMAESARARNMILIAVKAPDTGTISWWEHPEYTVSYLNSLLDSEAFGSYDIEKSKVWLAGYSGGTEYQTLYFLKTLLPKICGGGALLSAGGSVEGNSYDGQASDSTRANFRMHFYAGQDDTTTDPDEGFCGYCAATTGANYWQSKGFPVSRHFPIGVDHTQLDEPRELEQLWTSLNVVDT